MADFSFLSDTDESAVDEIIAEAIDHFTLKQIAAINCCSITDDSLLPLHLESRFRRLKTLPPPSTSSSSRTPPPPPPSPVAPPSLQTPNPQFSTEANKVSATTRSNSAHSPHRTTNPSSPIQYSKGPRLGSGDSSSPSISPDFSHGSRGFSKSRTSRQQSKGFDGNLRSGSVSLGSNSSSSPRELASPPRKNGCLCCSPKSVFGRKSGKGNEVGDFGLKDGIFSDLGSLSRKEKSKELKKALKEEERISKEAEKIIQWAKQASMRMGTSDIDDDELSDHHH